MQPLPEADKQNIPAFLNKLWSMVNDSAIDDLICWSANGTSFIISHNEDGAWFALLPTYYKHKNMSSFVRQLNMYGFHKQPNPEKGGMSERDKVLEFEFYHPYFQRGKPELLRKIKRKVPNAHENNMQAPVERRNDLDKVLHEVNNLHGRQNKINNELVAIRRENTVLWKEIAIARQKHQKQQQIVNKLIQFLLTLVQPSPVGGLGMKRHFSLMLNESPKRAKQVPSSSSDGPTIREVVEPEPVLPSDYVLVQSPASTSKASDSEPVKSPIDLLNEVDNINPVVPNMFLDKSSNLEANKDSQTATMDELFSDNILVDDESAPKNVLVEDEIDPDDVRGALLNTLINDSYNMQALNKGGKQSSPNKKAATSQGNMTVAMRDPKLEDMDFHIESAQSELDHFKEMLNGCGSIDSGYLLSLFNDNLYKLPSQAGQEDNVPPEMLVSGSELAPCEAGMVDFTELFEDSSNPPQDLFQSDLLLNSNNDTINTPDISIAMQPNFDLARK